MFVSHCNTYIILRCYLYLFMRSTLLNFKLVEVKGVYMFHVNFSLETDLLMDFYCVSLVISAVLCHLISVCFT